MNAKIRATWYLPLVLLLAASCGSSPASTAPSPEDLQRLDEAMARATVAREAASAANASDHFPDEWARAETDYGNGIAAGRETADAVEEAVASFSSAADLYERIASDSAPLAAATLAASLAEAASALEAAAARARASRQDALAAEGQTHFPSEWQSADSSFQRGESAATGTPAEMASAASLYVAAADAFDDIARMSRPLAAQNAENARQEMQAALARAEQSRRDALALRASNHFPAEWRDAEAEMRTGRSAGRGSPDEMREATAQLESLVATYDSLAARSRPLFERDEAQRLLTAAVARAERSRRAAENVNGAGFFPNDWRAAEADNRAGMDGPRDTAAQMQAATARLAAAADAYDDIARRSGPLITAARNEANGVFQAAAARADASRQAAMAVEGQLRFADEWAAAEAMNQDGRRARRTTPEETRQAAVVLNSAADRFDGIASRSAADFARAMGDADRALQAAMARAERSRQAAMTAEGPTNLPAEWRDAEARNQAAVRARRTTTEEMRSASALFVAAADSYDDIARRSGPIAAAARNDANREFQAALARADRSRRSAADVGGESLFPADWGRAEAANVAARAAPRSTVGETTAATARLNSAADGFDSIAARSAVAFNAARDEANGALTAAIARADASRQAAMDAEAQNFMQTEWRAAEAQIAAARRARRSTPDEMREAAALFVAAAAGYDDLARRSGPMLAAARNEANGALQAAITRATRSRQQAEGSDAQANLPREWTAATTRHRNAENARRATVAEMRAATGLYVAAADAFDDLIQRNVALAEGNEAAALASRARAEEERLAAVGVRADVAARNEFNRADSTFAQATAAFGARQFTAALNQYDDSASQFSASAAEAERRRLLADAAVEDARQSSAQSTAFAINSGLAMEEDNET